jgi:hypothetical protein
MSDPNAAFKIPQFLRNFQTFEAKFSEDDEIRTIGPPTMQADMSSPVPLDGRKQETSDSDDYLFRSEC